MSDLNFYAGKRVLVTGGLGFIGSNIAIRLVRAGAKVTIVDSALSDCGANPFNISQSLPEIDRIDCDVGSPEAFSSRLRETAIIFNLAGEISHSRSMTEPERDLQLNAVSQLRFLLACRNCCAGARIVYAGTRQVYGKPTYLPVDELHAAHPFDFNGVHKWAADQYHLLLARHGDLDCVVLRLSNVYGPRMALRLPQQGFLGVYFRKALAGEPIPIYGDGSQLRDPVHVDDVVNAFLAAGSAPSLASRIFNVGGPHALALCLVLQVHRVASSPLETLPS